MMSTTEGNNRPKRSLFDNPFIAEQVQRAGIELDSRVSKIEEYLAAQESTQASFAAAADIEASVPITAGTPETNGLRTELVTLEVTHRFADPIASVLLQALDSVLSGQGESVFVMDGSCEITKLTDERDTAIRERETLRIMVNDLKSQLENEACRKANWEKALELAAKFMESKSSEAK